MFKNALVYRIEHWAPPPLNDIETRLQGARFIECGASQAASTRASPAGMLASIDAATDGATHTLTLDDTVLAIPGVKQQRDTFNQIIYTTLAVVLAVLFVLLRAALAPVLLQVRDDSHLHAGHAGAREGGHYRLVLVSAAFVGKNTVARHRQVFSLLGDLMRTRIHALGIKAFAPDEV